MVNVKKLDYFDVTTGIAVNSKNYGKDAVIFKRTDNVDMIFDSRGNYLGITTCRGSFDNNGRYTTKKGPKDFKSFMELEQIWKDVKCCDTHFVESKDGTQMIVDLKK